MMLSSKRAKLEDSYIRNKRRLALVEPALVAAERISNPRALQHLKEGFNRRVFMLESTFRFLIKKAEQAGRTRLSAYDATETAIHLNAFYLNLCGALDNLAWAIQYERTLIPGVDESTGKRTQIGLFIKPFLDALGRVAPDLTTALRPHESWNADLRKFRDPAAHRIPIYAVPGVANQEEGEEFKKLQEEAARLFEEGDHDGGMALIYKSANIGTYEPLMSLSHETEYEVRGIEKQIMQDDEVFVAVGEHVLRFLFS